MVPLLDVLVSAAAIFIIVVAVQQVLPRQDRPPNMADILIVADAEGRTTWHSALAPQAQHVTLNEIPAQVRDYAIEVGHPVSVVVAIDSEHKLERTFLTEEFERMLREQQGPPDITFFGLRVTWWPLDRIGTAKARLLARWRGQGNGEGIATEQVP